MISTHDDLDPPTTLFDFVKNSTKFFTKSKETIAYNFKNPKALVCLSITNEAHTILTSVYSSTQCQCEIPLHSLFVISDKSKTVKMSKLTPHHDINCTSCGRGISPITTDRSDLADAPHLFSSQHHLKLLHPHNDASRHKVRWHLNTPATSCWHI